MQSYLPVYELANGSLQRTMTDGYFECNWMMHIFADNGAQTIVPNTLCDFGYQGETAALWTPEKNGKETKFQIPFFYDEISQRRY